MRKKTLLKFLAIATVIPTLCLAGEHSQVIRLRGQASGLKPGTRVSINFKVEHHLFDSQQAHAAQRAGAAAPEDAGVLSKVSAAERYQWEFVVPKSGTVPEKRMEFRIETPANGTSEGMDELIFIPVTYTISVPAEAGRPAKTMTRESTVGGPRSRFDNEACFRIQLFEDGFFAVGLADDCDKSMKHPKEVGVPAPRN